MFVWKWKYDALEAKHNVLSALYTSLIYENTKLVRKWNDLVRKVNARGGESFLETHQENRLSDDDIKRLLMLIHPDKHGGKPLAQEMTAKLLSLRTH